MAKVERALRDGSLNGKQHTALEIEELRASGKFGKRYGKFIGRITYSAETIRERIYGFDDDDDNSWVARWLGSVDPRTGDVLGTRATEKALANCMKNIEYIVDTDRHLMPLKKLPYQKHDLVVQKSTRGEKSETLHSVLGHFANPGTRPLFAQLLQQEGIVSMNMRQDAQLAFQRGEQTSPDVEHYEPWLMNKANALADAAMMPRPYKDVKTVGKDNGERFLWDYYQEQLEREKHVVFEDGMKFCPCAKCSSRRETCECKVCEAARGDEAWVARMPLGRWLLSNEALAVERLHAASVEKLASGDDRAAERESRVLELLSTAIRGGRRFEAIELARREGVDLKTIVGYVSEPVPRDGSVMEIEPDPVVEGFMSSLMVDAAPAPAPSKSGDEKKKKKLAAVRKYTGCPKCDCGKVDEVEEENKRRANMVPPMGGLRGKTVWCKDDCTQWKWIVQQGYREPRSTT